MTLNKRGAAHFEMIISFVLFIGIVTFLFFFISPYKNNTIQITLLEDAYLAFKEQTSTNLTTIFLSTDYDQSGCFTVDISGEILNYDLTESVAYDPSHEKRKSMVSSDKINIEGDDKFFDVLVSPIFSSDTLSGCKDLNENEYTIGSIVEKQIVAYPKILDLENEYEANYTTLRGKLSIPPTYDFAITSSGLGLNMETKIPAEVEVLSKNYVAEVLYDNGTIINAEIVVKVW